MTCGYTVGILNNKENENLTNKKNSLIENDIDLPIWSLGDNWTYNIEVEGEQNEYFDLDFDLDLANVKFEVIEIQDNMYTLSIIVQQGNFKGAISIDLGIFSFSGNIENSMLNGFLYIEKSTLGINSCEGSIIGDTNKIILPHFDIDFQLQFGIEQDNQGIKTNFSSLIFPINVDDIWNIPFTVLNVSINAHQPNLGQYRLFSYVYNHEVECKGWDVVRIYNNEFDALKISGLDNGERNDIWYSAAVGNIIKVDYKNVQLGYGYLLKKLTFDLLSTTFGAISNAPDIPSPLTGPTEVFAGDAKDYETSTVDPDGDKIRYIVDWGDGSEKSYSDFILSGEPIVLSHTWITKGDHEVRVKARDKFGKESDWSDPLIVTVENNNPRKPSTPEGPTSGKIKISYTYSTSSTDPDGHRIKYGFDWDGDDGVDDWTELLSSGKTASKSHTWTTKGNYEIKVKAQDEYGGESDWSDPLSITMPKNKRIEDISLKFIERYSYFSFLLQFVKY